MKAFFRLETAIFLGIWLTLMVAGRTRFLRDPGTFWHVVTGQRILDARALVESDPYSFTRGGEPWYPQSWLAECAMAAIDRVGGFDLLLLASVTLLAGVYAWIAHRLLRAGFDPVVVVLLLVLALGASGHHFHVRPHLLTMALLTVTTTLLIDFEAGRISTPRLFWLIPLFVFWANVHGGVLAGVGTLGLTIAGWLLYRALPLESPVRDRRSALALCGLGLACLFSIVASPYGTKLPGMWLSILGSNLGDLIEEHAPLDPHSLDGGLVLLLAAGYAVALVGVAPRRWRVTWLLPIVWLLLSVKSLRHGPLFVVTTFLALAEVLPNGRWTDWLRRHEYLRPTPDEIDRKPFDLRPALLPAFVVMIAIVLKTASIPVPVLGAGWARFDATVWPVGLVEQLRSNQGTDAAPRRIFNDLRFGGFLIHSAPGMRVFIDDRCELYGEPFLRDYVRAENQEPERIEEWADEYGFDLALTARAAGFDRYLATASGWREIGADSAARLYRRSPFLDANPTTPGDR